MRLLDPLESILTGLLSKSITTSLKERSVDATSGTLAFPSSTPTSTGMNPWALLGSKGGLILGQYFMPILGDQHGLNCQVFDRSVDGQYTMAKLMEHAWLDNSFVSSFSALLHNKLGRVCWVGDYANQPDDFKFNQNSAIHTPSYKDVWGEGVRTLSIHHAYFNLDHKFLVNFDTNEYINLDEYKEDAVDDKGWVIHPLPILTAVGNDRGFGDFHDGNIGYEHVGIWAWNLISIVSLPPPIFFNKIHIVLKEVN